MPRKRSSRRRQLLVKTLVPGVAFVLLGTLIAVLPSRGDHAPYVPGDAVEGITRGLERSTPDGFTPVRFSEVSREAGIAFRHFHGVRSTQLPEDMGSGVAWGDYDGDGDPDLYLGNAAGPRTARGDWSASPASNRLYRNEGDGTFSDVTVEAGVAVRELGMAAVWGDPDADRDLDLLVTNYGSILFFRNDGNGAFTEVSREVGLRREGCWSGASWADHDRDGDLDVYICGYVQYTFDPEDRNITTSQYVSVIPASLNPSTYHPHENVLFANNGDGTFSDVTERAGVANRKGRSLGAAWCDFDEDGWPDLYVANDISDNVLYYNRGDGTFQDLSHAAWVADYRGAMGIAVADFDSDQDLDMFISHWIAQENALYLNMLRDFEERSMSSSTPLNFVDDADRLGLGQIALDYVGWGSFFIDFDNDGRVDLFVANGSTFQMEEDERFLVPMKPLLFWNRGAEDGFFDVGEFCGEYFGSKWVGRGAAPADYDGDGDLDMAVMHLGDQMALLRNDGPPEERGAPHHWLRVDLRGRGKNTYAVGARVTLFRDGATQVAVVGATPSYLSQPELTVHFGLGTAEAIDRLEVTWPSGGLLGKRQVVRDVPVDRRITIEEAP